MGGEFKNRLAQMQEQWTSGKDKAGGVPDGVYNMQLQEAKFDVSGSGRLMVKRQHLITDGEYAGEVVYDNIVVDTEFGPRQLAEWIAQMGYEVPADMADNEDVVNAISMAAPHYQAGVKKGKDSDFRNVRIRQLLDAPAAEAAPAPAHVKKAAAAPAKPAAKVAAPAPVKKAAPAPKAAEPEAGLAEGTRIAFKDEDQNDAEGTVKGAGENEGDIRVEGDNGTLYDFAIGDLTVVEGEAVAEAPVEEDNSEETRAGLLAICVAHGIEVTDEDDLAAVTEKVCGQEWNKGELTEDEAALLEGVGAVFAAPKKAAPAPKAPVKAPAKPAPKAPAKPAPKAPVKPTPKPKGKK